MELLGIGCAIIVGGLAFLGLMAALNSDDREEDE